MCCLFHRIAVAELTDSFNLLKKMLQVNVNCDSQFETLSNINSCKATSSEEEGVGDGTTNPDESASETSPASFQSSYKLETIIIFDLCALSEIATSKSAILRVSINCCCPLIERPLKVWHKHPEMLALISRLKTFFPYQPDLFDPRKTAMKNNGEYHVVI